MAQKKNAAAVALGKLSAQKRGKKAMAAMQRKGGLAGGRARADGMTARERSDAASNAAYARWEGEKGKAARKAASKAAKARWAKPPGKSL